MEMYVKFDDTEVVLEKAPVYVTNMCLMNSKGQTGSRLGKKAKRALYMYLEWMLRAEEISKKRYEEELRLLTTLMREAKRIEVCVK